MSSPEVRIEMLLGAVVRDRHGESIGRIEEIRAIPDGDGLVVTHYLLGPTGWRARLSLQKLRLGLRTLRGVGRSRRQRLPWHAVDVSDPRRPRLKTGSPSTSH